MYFSRDFSVGDAFVGYHEDTIPSIVMQVCNDMEEEDDLPDETTEDTLEMKVERQTFHRLYHKLTSYFTRFKFTNSKQNQFPTQRVNK